MATLEDWFQTKNYEEGLTLLARYSKNRMLVQNLTKKTHPGKLEYELKKIAANHKIAVKKEAPKPQAQKPQKPAPKKEVKKPVYLADVPEEDREKLTIVRGKKYINPDDLPEDLKRLWEANRDSYKEIRVLSEKLKLMDNATAEDRQPLTERMCKLDDFVRANWELIDAWEPGSGKGSKKNESGQKIDHKRINANRKYISTNLQKLKAGMDAGKAEILKDNLKLRYTELLDAGEKLNQETIDELTKAGVI
jgi:hypothetical protein